jgi:hypothetical protein
MNKYEKWVVRFFAIVGGLCGLIGGLGVSIWINNNYGEQEAAGAAKIAVTVALIIVGYITCEFLTRGVFHIVNFPLPSPGGGGEKMDTNISDSQPLSLCGRLVPPLHRESGNKGVFASSATLSCNADPKTGSLQIAIPRDRYVRHEDLPTE